MIRFFWVAITVAKYKNPKGFFYVLKTSRKYRVVEMPVLRG